MKISFLSLTLCLPLFLLGDNYYGNPNNYTGHLNKLQPGDTLFLAPGDYFNFLNLRDLSGSMAQPIVITSEDPLNKPSFKGNACCNTVSIRRCAHIVIDNIEIDGQNIPYVDAVKAEGGGNNWTSDITLSNLLIINHGPEQQTNGISTKCPSWNWHVHHNTIIGAGTGMYFGNSNGEDAFVNGLIEYNLVINTTGYNCQIKRQNDGSRDGFPFPDSVKTIIRYNVFSKAENASSGNSARPNLLVGGLPQVGKGSNEHYEIYGNFFFQNPVEGLFQGSGSLAFYNNVLFNNAGGWGIAIFEHNGKKPRNVDIFNNTIVVQGRKSIGFYRPDASFTQRVMGNALFAQGTVDGASIISDNVQLSFDLWEDYFVGALPFLPGLNLIPLDNKLHGPIINRFLFDNYTDADLDFEGVNKTWTRRGAYTSTTKNPWPLNLEIRPEIKLSTTSINSISNAPYKVLQFNLIHERLVINRRLLGLKFQIYNAQGRCISVGTISKSSMPVFLSSGYYFIAIEGGTVEPFVKL